MIFRLTLLLSCIVILLGASVERAPDQAITFTTFTPHPSGLTINNGIAGTVCIEDGEPVSVCESAEFINIVGGEMCQWDENTIYPCTYYGHQFDYENASPGQVITCDTYRSNNTVFGPLTEQVTGARTARYTIELESDRGTVFRPSYNTYGPVEHQILIRESHRCS